jgi:hypothetical protein
VKSVSDLKGKKIAVNGPWNAMHFMVGKMLENGGSKRKEAIDIIVKYTTLKSTALYERVQWPLHRSQRRGPAGELAGAAGVVPSEQGHFRQGRCRVAHGSRPRCLRPGRVGARDAQEQAARGHLAEAAVSIR